MTVIFTATNFPLPSTPPSYFVPDASGRAVPSGHATWQLVIDTTGLTAGQSLVDVIVQYHYTAVQLGATGKPNQGQVTNTDGTVTQIDGGTFTGWIDDCEAPLNTTFTNKLGQVVHQASLGCDLNRIMGAYPDTARALIKSTPGYANIPSATLNVN